ncbi:MAG: hypothetical protein ACOYXU_00595 [Nitrospirota bacterium]
MKRRHQDTRADDAPTPHRSSEPTGRSTAERLALLSSSPWLPWAAIAAVILWFGKDFLFFGKVFLPLDYLQAWRPWSAVFPSPRPINNIVISDVVDGIYPLLHFVSDQLKSGHLPLWNPLVFLGVPTVMLGVSNFVFNPLYVVLLWLLSPATAHSLALLINLSLIASFSFLFFRLRGLTATASLIGAMVLTFNGHLMVWLEYALADFAFAGLAVSFYCYEKSLHERRLRFVLANGLVIGLLLLGGSIQWVFFLVPLLGLYAAARTVEQWDGRETLRHRLSPLLRYLAPLTLGVLIAAPNLLFFAEYMGQSQRSIRPFDWVRAHTATFHPELFATLLFPNFFGYQPGGQWFARGSAAVVFQNYNELGAFMGIATLPLVPLAWRATTHRRMVIFWTAIIIGAFLVAMKPPGLYYLLYRYVPGFNGMQPTRTIILLPAAFAYLAAVGADALQRRPLSTAAAARLGWGVLGLVAGLALVLVGSSGYFQQHPLVLRGVDLGRHFRIGNPDFAWPLALLAFVGASFVLFSRRTIGVVGLGAALLALLVVDLTSFGLRINTRSERSLLYPTTPSLRFLAEDRDTYRTLPLGLHYNTLMPFGIATLGGYASMFPASYLALISAMEAQQDPRVNVAERNQNYVAPIGYRSHLLPMLNVKYLITPPRPPQAQLHPDDAARLESRHRSDLEVFLVKDALPRAYAVPAVRQVSGLSEATAAMLAPEFDPTRTAIVETDVPELADGSDIGGTVRMTPPTIHRPDTDQLDVDTDYTHPTLLVISEQFFPGWKAFLDGAPAPLLRVDGVLMGTVVPEGRHRVTLRFQPTSITVGSWIATAAAALMIVLWAFDRRRASARKVPASPPVSS